MSPKVLLIYPEIPPTYWSYRYTLPFVGKKAAIPPVGLITVAALLPDEYEATLIDMNIAPLTDEAIAAADLVFTSSMMVQRRSHEEIVQRCAQLGKKVVAGGPFPTSCHSQISGVDHFVLNEAEITLPLFLQDYARGQAKPIYRDTLRPDLSLTPTPRFELLDMGAYASMALQFSRGCPHSCEFCDIIEMFGRVPRTKTPAKFVNELDALFRAGWRGSVFVVDDNFIGNRKKTKELLPQITRWQAANSYPFTFFTEATVNLADDDELMQLMVAAGFNMVFLGIETPIAKTLAEVGKIQNLKTDMLECVHKIQHKGLEVSGGFIIGFDNDPEDIFDRQIDFIQEAAIPVAMVGLLQAVPNTQLYRRLEAENRLVDDSSGNNTHDLRLNFTPKMDLTTLLDGYKRVIADIYKPKRYFERCLDHLRNLTPHQMSSRPIGATELRAFILSLLIQTFSRYGFFYWRFLIRAFFLKPHLLPEAVTLAVKGHHFFRMTRHILAVDRFKNYIERVAQSIQERAQEVAMSTDFSKKFADLLTYRDRVLADIRKEYEHINKDFQIYAAEALANLDARIDDLVNSLAGPMPAGVECP